MARPARLASTSLIRQYVTGVVGWRARHAASTVSPAAKLTWQQAVISLQTIILDDPVIVGGRTALELQGLSHYLARNLTTVHLHSVEPLPKWLTELPLDIRFVHHNSRKLFGRDPVTFRASTARVAASPLQRGLTYRPWGQWDWPLTLGRRPSARSSSCSTRCRTRESFHQADKIVEGAAQPRGRDCSKAS